MGSGKSTIGVQLAEKLGMKFIDVDDEIERKYNTAIKDIFAQQGEAWFRKAEEEMLAQLSQERKGHVISLGGGALISVKNLQWAINNGILIYIKSKPEEIWRRIRHSTRRPLLRGNGEEWTKDDYINRINHLLEQREKGYHRAHIIIDRDGKEVHDVIELIVQKIKSMSRELCQ